MKGTIAVTDQGWYEFLRPRGLPEVNFWTPSDHHALRAPQFSPFFFKLKAPHNAIAGFGFFARWTSLPDWLAWETFGEGNGCATLAEMRTRIEAIRRRIDYAPTGTLQNIGCILLVEPVFFPRDAWVPQPRDWHGRTVRGKAYDLTSGEGKRVWDACLERAAALAARADRPSMVAERGTWQAPSSRYGTPRLVAPRLGQGTFRIAVTDAYERACAVTGEHSLPVLDAAHIRSYSDSGPHEVANGILLRSDLHRLFDQGYITISPGHRVEVSRRLHEDYSNGRSYYPLHGTALQLPAQPVDRPAPEFIRWHNEHVFLG